LNREGKVKRERGKRKEERLKEEITWPCASALAIAVDTPQRSEE
jgi:hypothetical protein